MSPLDAALQLERYGMYSRERIVRRLEVGDAIWAELYLENDVHPDDRAWRIDVRVRAAQRLALERYGEVVRELQVALDLRPWTPLEQVRHRGELLATDEGREGGG